MRTFDHAEDGARLDFLDELISRGDILEIHKYDDPLDGHKYIKVFTILSQWIHFEQGVSIRDIIDHLMQFKLKHNIRSG